jgi:lysyl-tRNA synthetase class 2
MPCSPTSSATASAATRPPGNPRPTPLGELPAAWPEATDLTVVGRVRRVRDHGGVLFVVLTDGGRSIQLLFDAATLDRPALRRFAHLISGGDLLRVTGRPGRSRTGTPSLLVEEWAIEAKALHPIPFEAFEDPETRLRQRSVDLIVHPEQADLLRQRSAVVRAVRASLDSAGYLEVETPMLQSVHGGATARPFQTFSNAYGVDLSLRIAPELYLKRLLVGGLGPIYELGRNFRNEGADATHNPEFTSLEVYRPHADYVTMRHLTEDLIRSAATSLYGAPRLPMPTPAQVRGGLAGVDFVDVSGEWACVPVLTAVSEAVGRPITIDTDMDILLDLARTHHIPVRDAMGPGALIEELYAELVEPHTTTPTFYLDFPQETSP